MGLFTDLDPEVRFEIANAIWANENVPLRDAFFQAVTAAFDARAESRNFADPATLDAMNAWVEEHTGGADLTQGLTPGWLDGLSIPRFTLTHDTYLNNALQAMGMGPVFRPGADFTRMSRLGDQICIDFVRQKTFIEVDERGTRAAAATGLAWVSSPSTASWPTVRSSL